MEQTVTSTVDKSVATYMPRLGDNLRQVGRRVALCRTRRSEPKSSNPSRSPASPRVQPRRVGGAHSVLRHSPLHVHKLSAGSRIGFPSALQTQDIPQGPLCVSISPSLIVRAPRPFRRRINDVKLSQWDSEARAMTRIVDITEAWGAFVGSLPDKQGLADISRYTERYRLSESATAWQAFAADVKSLSELLQAGALTDIARLDKPSSSHSGSDPSSMNELKLRGGQGHAPRADTKRPDSLHASVVGSASTGSGSSEAKRATMSWFSEDSDSDYCSESSGCDDPDEAVNGHGDIDSEGTEFDMSGCED